MGLDMYLGTAPVVEGYTFHEIMYYENVIIEEIDLLPDDLRPYAYRKGITDWYSLTGDLGYWRNSHHVHAWFVENIQEGMDDYSEHVVTKEKLIELKETLEEVLWDRMMTGKHNSAQNKLAVHDNSLVDATYTSDYYKELRRTLVILEEALLVDFKKTSSLLQKFQVELHTLTLIRRGFLMKKKKPRFGVSFVFINRTLLCV